jgi:hypothetical protein
VLRLGVHLERVDRVHDGVVERSGARGRGVESSVTSPRLERIDWLATWCRRCSFVQRTSSCLGRIDGIEMSAANVASVCGRAVSSMRGEMRGEWNLVLATAREHQTDDATAIVSQIVEQLGRFV